MKNLLFLLLIPPLVFFWWTLHLEVEGYASPKNPCYTGFHGDSSGWIDTNCIKQKEMEWRLSKLESLPKKR